MSASQTSNGEKQFRKYKGNTAFMFVSCIVLKNVTVSSLLPTNLILFGGAEASLDGEVTCFLFVMIYPLSLFPLHFFAFCFYWYTNFFDVQIENVNKNRWMETHLETWLWNLFSFLTAEFSNNYFPTKAQEEHSELYYSVKKYSQIHFGCLWDPVFVQLHNQCARTVRNIIFAWACILFLLFLAY